MKPPLWLSLFLGLGGMALGLALVLQEQGHKARAHQAGGPIALESPLPKRPAIVYWLAEDGEWSAREQEPTSNLEERALELANAVLDRLRLGLLASDAMLGQDQVLYLFFSVLVWEPSLQEECFLGQSLARTLISDQPWLKGVRLVLPRRTVDWSSTLERFDPGSGSWIQKRRFTQDMKP